MGHHPYHWTYNWSGVLNAGTDNGNIAAVAASNNTGPGGGGKIQIGTAVVTHGGPGGPHPGGALPFTGADVGLYAAVGVAMMAAGILARLRARSAEKP